MFKFKKLQNKLLKISLFFGSIFLITSCFNTVLEDPIQGIVGYDNTSYPILHAVQDQKIGHVNIPNFQKNEEIFNFFNERLISITSSISKNPKTGTAWILAKAKNDLNNNEYYIGTNLHVASSFEKNKEHLFTISPFWKDTSKQIWSKEDLLNIKKNSLPEKNENAKFLVKDIWAAIKKDYTMDFAVMLIEFKNTYSKFNNFLETLKNKSESDLTFSDETLKENQKLKGYIAGYPGINNAKDLFGAVILEINDLPIIKDNNDIISTLQHINDNSTNKENIVFENNKYFLNAWNYSILNMNLGNGASGSLLIDSNAHALGIYWGIYQLGEKNNKFSTLSQGQISLFKKGNSSFNYNWINDSVENSNSLCHWIENKAKDVTYRIPQFCN